MSHVPKLRWRRRGNDAELLFSLEEESMKLLTAYVVDGPALRGRERIVNLLADIHDGWNRAAAVLSLGYVGLPVSTLGLAVRPDDHAQRLIHLKRLLADAPAYGRWWEPTAAAIAQLRRSLPSHALCVMLLLADGAPLPWEWDDCPLSRIMDAEPPAEDEATRKKPTVQIVRREVDALDTGNAEALEWEALLNRMDVLARQRREGVAGLFEFSIPFDQKEVPGLRLHNTAARQGWVMVMEMDDRLAITNPALHMAPNSKPAVLAELPKAGHRVTDLPLPPFRIVSHRVV